MKTLEDVMEMYMYQIREIAEALGMDSDACFVDYGTVAIVQRIKELRAQPADSAGAETEATP